MRAWREGASPSGSKRFAVPLRRVQSEVSRRLAAQRSPDSHIAGGITINGQGPRFSHDIDIFHDSAARLERAVTADEAALALPVTHLPGTETYARKARGDHRKRRQASSPSETRVLPGLRLLIHPLFVPDR
jgi:hypothetical protein